MDKRPKDLEDWLSELMEKESDKDRTSVSTSTEPRSAPDPIDFEGMIKRLDEMIKELQDTPPIGGILITSLMRGTLERSFEGRLYLLIGESEWETLLPSFELKKGPEGLGLSLSGVRAYEDEGLAAKILFEYWQEKKESNNGDLIGA